MPRTGEPADDLDVLLTDPRHLRREAVRRKKPFDEKVVTQDDLPEYLADGWVTDRATGKKTKIKRQKQIGERLENRFWMFLYRLGYPEMNAGKSFTAVIRRKGADDLRKQIDVFAKDDETVVVAECKAS